VDQKLAYEAVVHERLRFVARLERARRARDLNRCIGVDRRIARLRWHIGARVQRRVHGRRIAVDWSGRTAL
jgi:hypothetical protein